MPQLLAMTRLVLALAFASLLLLLVPAAAASPCPPPPPEQPNYNVNRCFDDPIVTSMGWCAGLVFGWARAEQVWLGETIACL